MNFRRAQNCPYTAHVRLLRGSVGPDGSQGGLPSEEPACGIPVSPVGGDRVIRNARIDSYRERRSAKSASDFRPPVTEPYRERRRANDVS